MMLDRPEGQRTQEQVDAAEATERARLAALAAEMRCSPGDVNAHKLAEYGVRYGEEATPAALSAPDAKAAKLAHDELAAAHLATFGEPIARDKAIAVAARVRAEPAKASILVAQAMADATVDAKIAKARQ